MNLYSEIILDLYKFKDKQILCHIKFNPKSHELKSICRFLSHEQWMTFDKELEKLVTSSDYLNNENSLKFNIQPCIEVKVQKSKLSLKHIVKLFEASGLCNKRNVNVVEHNIIFECLIDFQQEPLISSVDSQEYEPQIDASTDSKLHYEPYTPSKKKFEEVKSDLIKRTDIKFLEYNGDTYSPKPISDLEVIEPQLALDVPKYIPAPINTGLNFRERKKLNSPDDVIPQTDGELCYMDKSKSLTARPSEKPKRIEIEYIPKSQDVTIANVPVYIPTPIQETSHANVVKNNYCRTNKRRSSTIDVFPQRLDVGVKGVEITKLEQLASSADINNHDHSRKLKKRSMTIDEIPVALAKVPTYIPTPKAEEILRKCKFNRKNERSSSIDASSAALHENSKENHIFEQERIRSKSTRKNYTSKKCSIVSNEISVAISEFNALHKSKEKLENVILDKNNFSALKPTKLSSAIGDEFTTLLNKNSKRKSKLKTIESDIKLEGGNRIEKSNLENLMRSSLATDTHLEKTACGNNSTKVCRIENDKSFKKSGRSSNKKRRLVEEQFNLVNKSKKPTKIKSSPITKELFGTDDDDDDDDDDECCSEKNTTRSYYNDNKTNVTYCEAAVSEKFALINSAPSTKRKYKVIKVNENETKTEQDQSDMSKKSQHKFPSLTDEAIKSSQITNISSSSKLSSLKTSKLKPQKPYYDRCGNDQKPLRFKSLSMEGKSKRER